MKVLVYGLRGIGVETCKNLALQGVGAITVRDSPTDVYVTIYLYDFSGFFVRSWWIPFPWRFAISE